MAADRRVFRVSEIAWPLVYLVDTATRPLPPAEEAADAATPLT